MKMKKSELRDLYSMMFPEYPDIVNITQLQRIVALADDTDMQVKWRYFLKNIKNDLLEFAVVIEEIRVFLEPVFDAIMNEVELQNLWNSKRQIWE